MSTHNICVHEEISKISIIFGGKKSTFSRAAYLG